ncbi:hypothetical protein CU102_19180 [Phyllobacterium brassicacearum]|uniref:Uncharacterized protein n=1 Tax=Phyllobacterium brassicacearum TaxID=314235 RepID=A0A2P7BJI9_9HYPH|nr:hypothetical protein CU102_19180 [Phyllobacterium brassicacearum]
MSCFFSNPKCRVIISTQHAFLTNIGLAQIDEKLYIAGNHASGRCGNHFWPISIRVPFLDLLRDGQRK